MAAFRQHIAFSSLLGIGYVAVCKKLGIQWQDGVLAGGICGLAGMLPDLDSDSGRPVRELFGVLSIAAPLLLLHRLENAGFSVEETILFGAATYFFVRFGLGMLFKRLTVHRGMFHSLPAAIIAAEAVYLAHQSPDQKARLALAGGMFLGFLSHLVLDEIYSVDARGLRVRLKESAGSAIKLYSSSIIATGVAWLFLGVLTYLVAIDRGWLAPINVHWPRTLAQLTTVPGARAGTPVRTARR
jgi:hypothetical protein